VIAGIRGEDGRMKRKGEGVAAEAVTALGARIEAWRRTRPRRGAMPEELWREAAAIAARHGVYRVSQALRLNFENLKMRMVAGTELRTKPTATTSRNFVEVVGIGAVDSPKTASELVHTEIEIASDGGARLRLRHSGGGLDLPGVVEAFLRSGR